MPRPHQPTWTEARSLLDQAGVDPESLTFELQAYIDRPELPDVATVIQAQLAELGIKVEIKSGQASSLEPGWLEGDYDATLLSRGYLTDLADPGGYLSLTGPVRAATTWLSTATRKPTR